MKTFRANDGTSWNVAVQLPSHSSAIVVFQHPQGVARLDRYAILNAHGPQVNDPRGRLDGKSVLAGLGDRDLARLYRRSVPVSTVHPAYIVS
ncbi:MAG TPA: hypothetical protein VFV33_20300 [Gemmatimonadaceae bacterium]|nr:hypothetical protein [Gemmatimonadaceae bacterium]